MNTVVKNTLALSLFIISFVTFGQIHVVDNNPNSGAQYTVVQDAIDAASAGDTIIIAGSETVYSGFTVNKQLVLIGNGYNPQGSEQFGFATAINETVYFVNESENLNKDASGSYIEGMLFRNGIRIGSDNQDTVINITITKNFLDLNSYITLEDCYDVYIINNVLQQGITENDNNYTIDGVNSALFDVVSNIYILNNIFKARTNGALFNSFGGGTIISNNIFLNDDNTNPFLFSSTKFTAFTNNIVYGPRPNTVRSGCDYCTITHNLIIRNESTTFDAGTVSTGNNLENVDPQFTNVSGFQFDYAFDYSLQTESPAKTAATDGGELGIYGGAYPWPNGGESPYITSIQSQLPKITEFNIKTGSVPENGTVEAEVAARVSDNQ